MLMAKIGKYQFEFILKLHGQNSVNESLLWFCSILHCFELNHHRNKLLTDSLKSIESFSFKLRINVSCICHECIRNVSLM